MVYPASICPLVAAGVDGRDDSAEDVISELGERVMREGCGLRRAYVEERWIREGITGSHFFR